jgi:hypothetical protein
MSAYQETLGNYCPELLDKIHISVIESFEYREITAEIFLLETRSPLGEKVHYNNYQSSDERMNAFRNHIHQVMVLSQLLPQ